MYGWIWHKLPGGTSGKLLGSLALVIIAVALLMLFAFPWMEAHLPFGEVTVSN